MRGLLYALGVLAAFVVLLWIVGMWVPRRHRAVVSASFQASPDRLLERIRRVEDSASWRRDLSSVEIVEPGAEWIETTGRESVRYRRVGDSEDSLVVRIADDDLPWGGEWSYRTTSLADGRTRLTITEDGFVKSPIFRAVGLFLFDPTRTAERYLRDLGASFEEEIEIEERRVTRGR